MEKMNNEYSDILTIICEDALANEPEEKVKEIIKIVLTLVEAEKEYEFDDQRPRIKTLLDTLIKKGK